MGIDVVRCDGRAGVRARVMVVQLSWARGVPLYGTGERVVGFLFNLFLFTPN